MDILSVRFPPGAKSISLDMSPTEIVKSLKHCCKFFSQLDQDQEEEKKIYLPFCMYLAEHDFINELTDANARIHLGCIFADIFRLHAPENPFPAEQTKAIFMFLTAQLAHLKTVKSPLFSKAFHILENISTVKSYNICLDLDNESADEVFLELFKVLFSTVNSSHDPQLKARMLDVMVCIISESDSLSQKLFNVLLECLLDKNQKMNPSAYDLSRELLRKSSSNIEGAVMLFLQNALLIENAQTNMLAQNWPRLLIELYKISNVFFSNAIPQLELKLRTDNLQERLQVVRLLKRMFSEKNSELAYQHPILWTCFLARFNDIEAEVRTVCVAFSSDMIINHCEDEEKSRKIVDELIQLLKLRRHDTDEGVRAAVVITIRAVAVHDIKVVSDELLGFLRERLLDKKHKVRETAVRAVADVCKKLYSNYSYLTVTYKNRLQDLQSQLLHVYYTQSIDDCVLIERIFASSIVQYSLPDVERMQRLLQLFCSVDNRAIKAVNEIFKRQNSLRGFLSHIVQCLHSTNETERNRRMWPDILSISALLRAPVQAREHIKKFFSIARNDKNLLKRLQYLVADQYTCKKVALTVRDILKNLEQNGVAKAIRQTVQQFLERTVLVTILVDPSSLLQLTKLVDGLLNDVSKSDHDGRRALDLLCILARHDPNLFAGDKCFEIVLGMLRGKDEYVVQNSLLIFFSTASVIEQRFQVVRTILIPELKAMAKTAPPYQAKYAVKCINIFTSVRETPLMQIYQQCKEKAIEDPTPSLKVRTLLTTLGCIAECLPSRAGKDIKGFIAAVVVKKIIMQTRGKPSRKKDVTWCPKNDVSEETATKLVAMKCMVRWLCGLKSNDSDCCGSTMRLLQHMMHNNGDLMKCGYIPKVDMAHLRLQAAFCVIKIAGCDSYQDLIPTSMFIELSALLMDDIPEVRQALLSKLYKALFSFKVHASFLSLFWVIPQEKLKEYRDHGAALYRQLVMRYRAIAKEKSVSGAMPEYALSFTIYLLANDPDLPLKEDLPKSILSGIKDSITFMLDPLLTRDHPESFGFIKRLAEMIKRTKLEGNSDNQLRSSTLYKVCDLVLQSVLMKSAQYAVGIIEPPDHAMQRFLPSRLYSQLDAEENNQNYLPEAFKIEPKLVPVRLAKSGKQANISIFPEKLSAKYPRKIVAVTKVSLPHHSDSSSLQSNGEDLLNSPSQICLPVKNTILRKRTSIENSSSDEETLAAKRTKLMKERKPVSRKNKKNQNAGSNAVGTKRGTRREIEKSKQMDSNSPEMSKSLLQSSDSSPSISSRPKRASAGSKMFDYLRTTKKTPIKSKQAA